jgi:hypothetical protein
MKKNSLFSIFGLLKLHTLPNSIISILLGVRSKVSCCTRSTVTLSPVVDVPCYYWQLYSSSSSNTAGDSSSKQQHHIFFIPVQLHSTKQNLSSNITSYSSPSAILVNLNQHLSHIANIQYCRKNTPMATSESPTATTLQDGNPPCMETIAGC